MSIAQDRKNALIDEIITGSIYTLDSGLAVALRKQLLKLTEIALGQLKVITLYRRHDK